MKETEIKNKTRNLVRMNEENYTTSLKKIKVRKMGRQTMILAGKNLI